MTSISTPRAPFNRLLLTGAAGGLGKVLRERLRPYAKVLRAWPDPDEPLYQRR